MEEVKKSKKKNKVASLLLALALILTCGVAGTIAQYQKTLGGTSSANVANFEVTASNMNAEQEADLHLFENVKDSTGGTEDDVDDTNKIAPGTSGSIDVTLTNSSEVTVSYKLTAQLTNGGVYRDSGNSDIDDKKIPLEFALVDSTASMPVDGAPEWKSIDDLVDEDNTTLTNNSGPLAMNGQSGNTVTKKLYWRWAYKSTSDTHRNELDTAIGEIMKHPDTSTADITNDYKNGTATFTTPTLKVSVVFTQED